MPPSSQCIEQGNIANYQQDCTVLCLKT